MISKINQGQRVNGLIYYLFGPGRHEEHESPRLIASWDGLHEYYQDHTEAELSELLNQPLSLSSRPPNKVVWHTSLRNHANDRTLTDAEWADVARDVLAEAGIAGPDIDDGARWLLVRHADDHVHLVATLVGEGTGRTIRNYNDRIKVRQACRRAEERFELRPTGAGVGTPSVSQAELAQHEGPEGTPREQLRSRVRSARAAATSPEEFLNALAEGGVMVRRRMSENDPTEITGYSVAWPRDTSGKDGGPIWFGGGKLAPDLSWPRIVSALESQTAIDERDERSTEAPSTIEEITARLDRVVVKAGEGVVGQRVRALDRGNIGTVVATGEDGRLRVHFRSPDGKEATISLRPDQIELLDVGKTEGDQVPTVARVGEGVVGQRVRALDRGNIGTVVATGEDGRLRVHFRSPDGKEATISLRPDEIEVLEAPRVLDADGFFAGTESVARSLATASEGSIGGPLTSAADHVSASALERAREAIDAQERQAHLAQEMRNIATLIHLLNPNRSDVARIALGVIKLLEVAEQRRALQGRRAQALYAREARQDLAAVGAPSTRSEPGPTPQQRRRLGPEIGPKPPLGVRPDNEGGPEGPRRRI